MRSFAQAFSDRGWDQRLGGILLARGVPLLVLAAIAIRWPDETLGPAMTVAGGLAIALGILELVSAWSAHALPSIRWFLVGHAALSIAFGVLTLATPAGAFYVALGLAVVWLLGYATFLILLAARLWYFSRMRDALLGWAAVNTGVIIASVAATPPTMAMLEYAGALYTAAYGFVLIVAGEWARRGWMSVEHVPLRPADSRRP